MITKLTQEQKEQIPQYIQKWISIASQPMNQNKAFKAIKDIYKQMRQKEPIIIIGHSPLNAALLCALFWSLWKEDNGQLRSQLSSQLRSQLNSQLDLQLD